MKPIKDIKKGMWILMYNHIGCITARSICIFHVDNMNQVLLEATLYYVLNQYDNSDLIVLTEPVYMPHPNYLNIPSIYAHDVELYELTDSEVIKMLLSYI